MELNQTMDASIWADEFIRKFGGNKEKIDRDLMLGWFANAIMTGYDHRSNLSLQSQQRTIGNPFENLW